MLCSASFLHAQYKVRFIVKEATSIKHDSVFIAGTFNNWDSLANSNYRLKPIGNNEFSIVLNISKGVHRFKITRGNWATVEKQFNGDEIPDHICNIKSDTTFSNTVIAWRDQLIVDKWVTLSQVRADTARINIYTSLANIYAFYPEWYNGDSALYYAGKALSVLQRFKNSDEFKSTTQANYIELLMRNQEVTASLLHTLGNYPKALELRLENLKLAETVKNNSFTLFIHRSILADYISMKDYKNVLNYARRMQVLLQKENTNDDHYLFFKQIANLNMAEAFYNLAMLDSCLHYAKMAYNYNQEYDQGVIWAKEIHAAYANKYIADVYAKRSDFNSALVHYRISLSTALSRGIYHIGALSEKGISTLFQKQGQTDSALYHAKHALSILHNNELDIKSWGENADSYIIEITPIIASLYKEKNQPDSAYKYLQLSVDLRDSLYTLDKIRQFQTLSFNESVRQQQMLQQADENRRQYEEKLKFYGLIGGLLIVMIIALLLYRNNKQKQKINLSLEKQKVEIENALDELKKTQSQLIQSEKMASLGELTAGIAHEIQNPLNFVNNFSDVNRELLAEMNTEINKGNLDEAKALAQDVIDNEEKINHHGKRADAIVKGMLQHSRSNSNQKEPTNINKLADEYLRLAYHGLRAKDNSFNSSIETNYDPAIENIMVISQDVGRVLLNLYTNAFYAVMEKKKQSLNGYEPIVTVCTKRLGSPSGGGKVEISVKDNGNGIPQKILDKIFQPFFTTKPTGQGTGLGLSLAYDIVKAHGGVLDVTTKEGEGSVFIIELPEV
jgi:signal transduction histidine kinase